MCGGNPQGKGGGHKGLLRHSISCVTSFACCRACAKEFIIRSAGNIEAGSCVVGEGLVLFIRKVEIGRM